MTNKEKNQEAAWDREKYAIFGNRRVGDKTFLLFLILRLVVFAVSSARRRTLCRGGEAVFV